MCKKLLFLASLFQQGNPGAVKGQANLEAKEKILKAVYDKVKLSLHSHMKLAIGFVFQFELSHVQCHKSCLTNAYEDAPCCTSEDMLHFQV